MSSRSGKGFVFTAEALFALLCFGIFIASLSMVSFDDYSDVVLYKQTGDYAQIAMAKQCEHNESCLQGLRSLLGKGTTEKCATVTRTAYTGDAFEDVAFTLCAQ